MRSYLNVLAAATFALTATAAAANVIGGIEVSDADWPFVVSYCEDLEDLSIRDAAKVRPSLIDRLSPTTINVESLSKGDCLRAGIIED